MSPFKSRFLTLVRLVDSSTDRSFILLVPLKTIIYIGLKSHSLAILVSHICIQVFSGRLVDENGVIYPPGFYIYLSAWTSNSAIEYAFSEGNLRPTPRQWFHDKDDQNLESEFHLFFIVSRCIYSCFYIVEQRCPYNC